MSGEDGRTCYNCGYIQRNGGAPEPLPDQEIEYCPDLTNGQVFKKTVLVIVSNLQAKRVLLYSHQYSSNLYVNNNKVLNSGIKNNSFLKIK